VLHFYSTLSYLFRGVNRPKFEIMKTFRCGSRGPYRPLCRYRAVPWWGTGGGAPGCSKLNLQSSDTLFSLYVLRTRKIKCKKILQDGYICDVLVRYMYTCNSSIRSTCAYLLSHIFVAYMHQLLNSMFKFESDSCQFLLNMLP